MKRLGLLLLLCLMTFVLFSCGSSIWDKYQLVSEKDGNLTFLDNRAGKVYYVNRSGNIVDVVDLRISEQNVQSIKKAKDTRESSQKNRDLGEQAISGTKFTLNAQIRYYKDRLLYHIEMKPYDETAVYKAGTIRVDLVDTMGFTLEKIEPGSWYTEVNSKGNRIGVAAAGEIPMTLDNFLEVSNWSPTWRF